jgi:transposase-like protein
VAHDPKIKAAALADLLGGMSIRAVAKKYKVSNSTAGKWANEHEEPPQTTESITRQARIEQFEQSLLRYLGATMAMLESMALVAGDADLIRKSPDIALKIGDFVVERADRIAQRVVEGLRREADRLEGAEQRQGGQSAISEASVVEPESDEAEAIDVDSED